MEAERTRSSQLCKEKSGAVSFEWRGEQALMPWGKKEFALSEEQESDSVARTGRGGTCDYGDLSLLWFCCLTQQKEFVD